MLRTIGMMSGTSIDGVDAAWVETDGERIGRLGPRLTLPYDDGLRRDLREILDRANAADAGNGLPPDDPLLLDCVRRLTLRHAEAVAAVAEDADLIGFHGQTILHRPARRGGFTWQVGDAAMLAETTGLPVAHDFRSADVAAGGQGAPLLPVYHAALAAGLGGPVAILNLGGVANVTLVGAGELVAFDTGPANSLIDAAVEIATDGRHRYDKDGRLAARGTVDEALLDDLLRHPYFAAEPPKSTGREEFGRPFVERLVQALPPEGDQDWMDLVATLTELTARTVARVVG